MLSHVRMLGAYNAWANERLTSWLRSKPADVLDEPVPSSFPGLRPTLHHIRSAEAFWLGLFTNRPPAYGRIDDVSEVLFDSLVSLSQQLAAFVHGLSEQQLVGMFPADGAAGKSPLPLCQYLLHVFNHSTFHRGQLITIARNVGLTDPPNTDLETWLLTR